MKVDFSSGGCQKLPKWVRITDQNADLLQLVRKIFCSKSWTKIYSTYFTAFCNFKCIWALLKLLFSLSFDYKVFKWFVVANFGHPGGIPIIDLAYYALLFEISETNLTSWHQSSVHSCFCDVFSYSHFCQKPSFLGGILVWEGLKTAEQVSNAQVLRAAFCNLGYFSTRQGLRTSTLVWSTVSSTELYGTTLLSSAYAHPFSLTTHFLAPHQCIY